MGRAVTVTITGSGPMLSSEKLKALEERLDIALPEQYRDFLLQHNGGTPDLALFECAGGGGSFVRSFLGAHEGPHSNFEVKFLALKVTRKALPDNIVAVAEDGFGNLVCLSLAGADVGSVYFWDHERETETPSYKNMHLIAPSFNEFLAALHSKPVKRFEEEFRDVFQHGNAETLRRIIAEGWDVNSGPYRPDISALEFVATANHLEVTRVLLQHGAKMGRVLEMTKRYATFFGKSHPHPRDYTQVIELLNDAPR